MCPPQSWALAKGKETGHLLRWIMTCPGRGTAASQVSILLASTGGSRGGSGVCTVQRLRLLGCWKERRESGSGVRGPCLSRLLLH